MPATVANLIAELERLEGEGHGDKIVKFVGSCPACGAQCDAEVDSGEPGDSAYPDEVWIS